MGGHWKNFEVFERKAYTILNRMLVGIQILKMLLLRAQKEMKNMLPETEDKLILMMAENLTELRLIVVPLSFKIIKKIKYSLLLK